MNQMQLRAAILQTPKRHRAAFDDALAAVTADQLGLLRTWLNAGLVLGDWRRAAVTRRIEELEAGE